MSGGPVWRVRDENADSRLWLPQAAGKIVGVIEAYIPDDQVSVAHSVKRWGTWFHDLIRDIDDQRRDRA